MRGVTSCARNQTTTERVPVAKKLSKSSAKPRLLSGGNPQIPRGDGDAPVAAYIAALPDWKQDVGARIDRAIMEAVPHAKKAVKWNSPFYGVEGHGWFLAMHAFEKYMKITFFRGASLDPPPPIASKVPEVRYLHIEEGSDFDDAQFQAQFQAWVRAASKLPGGEGLGPC